MFELEKIKGIIFDYGGTIDTNGMHWSEIIWMSYEALHIPVDKKIFREAYVYGERTMAQIKIIQPKHNFWHVLRLKAEAQIQWLIDNGHLPDDKNFTKYTKGIADWCYAYAQQIISGSFPVLKKLAERYPLALVTNFYGNVEYVLKDFHLDCFFSYIIESAVVGVKKPNPEIFRMGISKLGFNPDEVAVIGHSYEKDIIPASSLGCQTIWLKSIGWNLYKGDETATAIISDFTELKDLFKL